MIKKERNTLHQNPTPTRLNDPETTQEKEFGLKNKPIWSFSFALQIHEFC
jgi:hypothetical protein